MALLDQISETEPYKQDYSRMAQGITFHLPTRRRFIPYSWLRYSELNHNETELQLHYTHSVVTITGTHLHHLHDAVEHFQLKAVRELASPAMPGNFPDATVSRIEITEKTYD